MFEKDEKSDTGLYIVGWCLLGALLVLGVFLRVTGLDIAQVLGQCSFHRFTGLYCPGCGGTRAMRALFSGNMVASFVYHPFVIYIALFGGWFMISQTIERISKGRIKIAMHFRDVYMWIALAIIIINVFAKNIALLVWGMDLLAF